MIDFLFISNGYGEDAIGAKIAQFASEYSQVAAFPLVGEGVAYRNRGIEVAGSFPPLPGAGVSLWSDFRHGLVGLLRNQWRTLQGMRGRVRFAVAVGDLLPCIFSRFSLKRDYVFVGTAKSVYVQRYNLFERQFLKRSFQAFVRDEETALALKGIGVRWVGNPMLDEIAEEKNPFPPFSGRTVALFPGSRAEAPQNFLIQMEALNALSRSLDASVRGIVLIPPMHSLESFLSKIEGWDGIVVPRADSNVLAEMEQEGVKLLFASDCVGDILRACVLVFGQAGTANEQAAAFGKPIVAFDFDHHRNGKLSWYRWRQKMLLGKALAVAPPRPESLARKAAEILESRALYEEMSASGKARMGPPGGARKIAEFLLQCIGSSNPIPKLSQSPI